MHRFWRTVVASFGVVAIGGISYCSFNFAGAEHRVQELCSRIQPGMSIAELHAFVSAHALRPMPRDSGISYVMESKSFGRHGCKVNVEAGVVKAAEYLSAS